MVFDLEPSSPSSRFMQSGQDATSAFQFLRALLILPEEGVWGTTAPPYAVSEHGFISPDGKPVIVRLKTKVCDPWSAACLRSAVCLGLPQVCMHAGALGFRHRRRVHAMHAWYAEMPPCPCMEIAQCHSDTLPP